MNWLAGGAQGLMMSDTPSSVGPLTERSNGRMRYNRLVGGQEGNRAGRSRSEHDLRSVP